MTVIIRTHSPENDARAMALRKDHTAQLYQRTGVICLRQAKQDQLDLVMPWYELGGHDAFGLIC